MDEVSTLLNNQVFVGLVGAMVSGWVMYLCKEVPVRLARWIGRAFVVEMTVNSEDDVFHWLDEWLSRQRYSQRARRLRLSMSRDRTEDWLLTPGFGHHLLWLGGRPLLIERSNKEPTSTKEQSFLRPSATITITTLGRSQAQIRQLIGDVGAQRFKQDRLDIHIWQASWWQRLSAREKRPLHTVVLPQQMKFDMVNDADRFFGGAGWYAERGVPYRRGWLFEGGPGTGKTSSVAAIASHFGRPIYYLNLSTIRDDNSLLEACTTADRRSILLLEDVDAVRVAQQRPDVLPATDPDVKSEATHTGVTLSGLLNALDGVASADGRLLIMTTNHSQHLDRALVRPGRVDRIFRFDVMVPEAAAVMARAFFPDDPEVATAAAKAPPATAATWQGLFMQHRDDPAALLAVLATS